MPLLWQAVVYSSIFEVNPLQTSFVLALLSARASLLFFLCMTECVWPLFQKSVYAFSRRRRGAQDINTPCKYLLTHVFVRHVKKWLNSQGTYYFFLGGGKPAFYSSCIRGVSVCDFQEEKALIWTNWYGIFVIDLPLTMCLLLCTCQWGHDLPSSVFGRVFFFK